MCLTLVHLTTQCVREVPDCLTPTYACAATVIYLIPELCQVHPLRVPVLELARRALSGLLYRLRNLLLAHELRSSFHKAVKDLPACAVGTPTE